jgi:hypothetical protein
MKTFAALSMMLVASAFLTTGCGSPGYNTIENGQRVLMTWDYDAAQAVDDVNHVLMLRPASRMTIWNVRAPVGE